jgi:hypothetical protein
MREGAILSTFRFRFRDPGTGVPVADKTSGGVEDVIANKITEGK